MYEWFRLKEYRVCGLKKPHTLYLGVDNEIRTRDLDLGKVALYQLSYVHMKHQYYQY